MRTPTRTCCLSALRTNALTILTMLGVAFGIGLGLILRSTRDQPWSARDIMYVNFIGELFLRMLKCLILPLIVASLISAIGSLDLSLSRKIGGRAIVYYITTTILAVIQGIILVMTIKPGAGGEADKIDPEDGYVGTMEDTMLDLVRKMFPPNIVQACIFNDRTVLTRPKLSPEVNESDVMTTMMTSTVGPPEPPNIYEWDIKMQFVEGMNIMGLVVFSIVLGITLGKMGREGRPLLNVFSALSQAMMIITKWVIWLAPVGVMFLIASEILRMDDFTVIVGQLGMYVVTVLIGVLFHGFVVLPIIFFVVTRTLPFKFIANMAQALATAFSTASSSATLPVAMAALEEKNGIDARVSRFVMPIGATINMDGTALYEAVAAIFIAQVRKVPLSIGGIIAISITATMASIGAAGIPQAGLITMVMVLDAVGLPAEDVTLILAVDWLLDRFRTMINVLGDSLGAGIVYHLSKQELANIDNPERSMEVCEVQSEKPPHVASELTEQEKPPHFVETEHL